MTKRGTDIRIDHAARTVVGRVELPGPTGRCPHQIMATNEAGQREPSPCIGAPGHPGERHADVAGRIWP